MEEELTNQDKNEEMQRLEFNKLNRMYCKLVKQNTLLSKCENNPISKEDDTLITRAARMEAKLEILKTKLKEQSKSSDEQERELL
jgi:hypothetical protein